jgi:hypothetical protein
MPTENPTGSDLSEREFVLRVLFDKRCIESNAISNLTAHDVRLLYGIASDAIHHPQLTHEDDFTPFKVTAKGQGRGT